MFLVRNPKLISDEIEKSCNIFRRKPLRLAGVADSGDLHIHRSQMTVGMDDYFVGSKGDQRGGAVSALGHQNRHVFNALANKREHPPRDHGVPAIANDKKIQGISGFWQRVKLFDNARQSV
jgi:hypothetical protein